LDALPDREAARARLEEADRLDAEAARREGEAVVAAETALRTADLDEARALGLGGVPAFVIDRTYLVSGAQPPDTLLGALRRAREAPASTAA
ncbi:MAG TPA: hypothetical protein VHB30_10640, partial [Solirubrobacteraceae bacterium]|nr:hypothetical protein [Solirubrobacteraceae bacterium]